jgi:hypothetical protein
LKDANLVAWHDLVSKIININLTNDKDIFVWNLHKSGVFKVHSLYTFIIQQGVIPQKCPLWKIKVPLKIMIFLWYLFKGVTLTKDNPAKIILKGNLACCSCSSLETIGHLFFDCHAARFVWNTIYITLEIQPPTSTSHMFGSWLLGFNPQLRNQISLGAAALCWSI